MSNQYHYDVEMACSGCSGAVTKVLSKLDGLEKFDVSLEKQSVDVTSDGSLSYDDVLGSIKKTGKKVLGGKIVA